MHRVRLPKNFVPRFPGACVGCGRVEEERLRALGDPRLGSELAWIDMGGPLTPARPLVMPMCRACEDEIRSRTWSVSLARPIGFVIGGIAAGSVLETFGASEDGTARGFVLFLVIVVGALLGAWCGQALALRRRPPPVRVIGAGPRALEFRDLACARAFAAANDFEVLAPSVWRL